MKMHNIVELGTPGCEYTGGGIWVAYLPILVDGEKLELWYDNEAYEYDDDNAEFTVYKRYEDNSYEQMLEYGDSGVFVDIPKDSPLFPLYKKLRKAMKKALETDHPFDSVPFSVSVEQMRNAVMRTLKEHYNKDIPIKSITKDSRYLLNAKKDKTIIVELENGQRFTLAILE